MQYFHNFGLQITDERNFLSIPLGIHRKLQNILFSNASTVEFVHYLYGSWVFHIFSPSFASCTMVTSCAISHVKLQPFGHITFFYFLELVVVLCSRDYSVAGLGIMSKYCSLMRLELHKSFNHPIETRTEALHLLLRLDDVNNFSIHNLLWTS